MVPGENKEKIMIFRIVMVSSVMLLLIACGLVKKEGCRESVNRQFNDFCLPGIVRNNSVGEEQNEAILNGCLVLLASQVTCKD